MSKIMLLAKKPEAELSFAEKLKQAAAEAKQEAEYCSAVWLLEASEVLQQKEQEILDLKNYIGEQDDIIQRLELRLDKYERREN